MMKAGDRMPTVKYHFIDMLLIFPEPHILNILCSSAYLFGQICLQYQFGPFRELFSLNSWDPDYFWLLVSTRNFS